MKCFFHPLQTCLDALRMKNFQLVACFVVNIVAVPNSLGTDDDGAYVVMFGLNTHNSMPASKKMDSSFDLMFDEMNFATPTGLLRSSMTTLSYHDFSEKHLRNL